MPKRARSSSRVARGKKSRRAMSRVGGAHVRTAPAPGINMPDKQIVSLVYCVSDVRAPGVAQEDRVYRLNSLFDPEFTGVGHQPYGYDQMAAFYNRYRVLKASWIVTMIPTGGVINPHLLCVVPTNVTSTFTNGDLMTETPYAKYGWSKVQHTAASAGPDPVIIKGSINLGRLYGVSQATLKSDDRFAADFDSDPAEAAALHVGVFSAAGGTVVSYAYHIRITYTAEMYDRKQLATS